MSILSKNACVSFLEVKYDYNNILKNNNMHLDIFIFYLNTNIPIFYYTKRKKVIKKIENMALDTETYSCSSTLQNNTEKKKNTEKEERNSPQSLFLPSVCVCVAGGKKKLILPSVFSGWRTKEKKK